MSDFKEKSNAIISKCLELGCLSPPNVDYLEKIERSRNCTVFDNFVARCHDRKKIREIRNNILVNTSKDDTRPTSKLPAQLQLFMRSKVLARQIQDAKNDNKDMKRREQSHLDDIYQNSTRLVASENAVDTLISKNAILRAHIWTLEDDRSKEVEAEQKILSEQPQKLGISHNVNDLNEKMGKMSILLREFYNDVKSGGDFQVAAAWSGVRDAAKDVPSYFVYQQVMKELDSNNAYLRDLNAVAESTKQPDNPFVESVMPELVEQIIFSGVITLAGRKKLALLKSKCSDAIQVASYKLENLLNYDDPDNSYLAEDLGRDFMASMLKNFSLRGKIQQLNEIISSGKQKTEEKNQSFSAVCQGAQKINSLIEKRVDDGQQNVVHLLTINDKLNSGKFTMARMVQELKSHCKQLSVNRGMKFSQVFGPEVPSHRKQLTIFLSIPLGSFVKRCLGSSDQHENILLRSDETLNVLVKQGLLDVLNLCELLSTTEKALEWSDVLKIQATKKTKHQSSIIQQASIIELEGALHMNREAISEYFDAISKNHSEAKRLLHECQMLYKYWLENPLKRFIPDSKRFEGKSFKSYEKEFSLYYGMIKN